MSAFVNAFRASQLTQKSFVSCWLKFHITHIHGGCFSDTGGIVLLPQCLRFGKVTPNTIFCVNKGVEYQIEIFPKDVNNATIFFSTEDQEHVTDEESLVWFVPYSNIGNKQNIAMTS